MLQTWPAPGGSEEYALCFNRGQRPYVLILPAWFDEGNKTRHFSVALMRTLDRMGVDSLLPDLPGCNESRVPLDQQTIVGWQACAADLARQMGCTHVLTIRAGANIAPPLPGWSYAPLAGKSALRALLRARIIAAREAGREEKSEDLLQKGLREGLELAGYHLGPQMVAQLAEADLAPLSDLAEIKQSDIGGSGLWLRAEPDHDQDQVEALAFHIVAALET